MLENRPPPWEGVFLDYVRFNCLEIWGLFRLFCWRIFETFNDFLNVSFKKFINSENIPYLNTFFE